MSDKIWKIEYEVYKVNRDKHHLPNREHAAPVEQITRLIKQEAEQLKDRFDFAYVKVTAHDMSPGSVEKFEFVVETDEGFRDEWQSGRP